MTEEYSQFAYRATFHGEYAGTVTDLSTGGTTESELKVVWQFDKGMTAEVTNVPGLPSGVLPVSRVEPNGIAVNSGHDPTAYIHALDLSGVNGAVPVTAVGYLGSSLRTKYWLAYTRRPGSKPAIGDGNEELLCGDYEGRLTLTDGTIRHVLCRPKLGFYYVDGAQRVGGLLRWGRYTFMPDDVQITFSALKFYDIFQVTETQGDESNQKVVAMRGRYYERHLVASDPWPPPSGHFELSLRDDNSILFLGER